MGSRDEKLSETMQQTIVTLLEHGQLDRWSGGWWTYPGCTVKHHQTSAFRQFQLEVPVWSLKIGSIMALVKRGYAELQGKDEHGFPTRAVPTTKAKDLI